MSTVTVLLLKDENDTAPVVLVDDLDFPEIPPVPSPLILTLDEREERFKIVSWFYKGIYRKAGHARRSTGSVRLHLLVIRASPIARPQTPGLIV